MSGAVKKAVIQRIADNEGVPYAEAHAVYRGWSPKRKQRACYAEKRRRAKARRAAEPHEQSMASLVIEASVDRAMGLPVEDWIAEGCLDA